MFYHGKQVERGRVTTDREREKQELFGKSVCSTTAISQDRKRETCTYRVKDRQVQGMNETKESHRGGPAMGEKEGRDGIETA